MKSRHFTRAWWRAIGRRFARAGILCGIAAGLLALEPGLTLSAWLVSACWIGTLEIGSWLGGWVDGDPL